MLVFANRRLDRPMKFRVELIGQADPATDQAQPHLAGVQALTRWYNQCLEQVIRRYPQQYWWIHRRWRDVPEKVAAQFRRRVEAASEGQDAQQAQQSQQSQQAQQAQDAKLSSRQAA